MNQLKRANIIRQCVAAILISAICWSGFLSGCVNNKSQVLGNLPSPILTTGQKSIAGNVHKNPPNYFTAPAPTATYSGPDYFASRSRDYFASAPVVPAEWYPPISDNDWQVIVIHHSASDTGGARAFDVAHRARGWDELGYHFVIGNGTDTPDGYIEVGSRWFKQKHGAHCKTPSNFYNDFGIGICIVGNFDNYSPSERQMRSLKKLVNFLCQRYHIPANRIYGHREAHGASTHCPGRYFPITGFRNEMAGGGPIWATSTR